MLQFFVYNNEFRERERETERETETERERQRETDRLWFPIHGNAFTE